VVHSQRRDRQETDARDFSYVMIFDEHSNDRNASREDFERAKSLRRGDEPIFWFRRSGREYEVRDPAVVAQFREMWRAVGEIGARQGALGAEQGVLGAKRGDLGAKQGVIGAEQGLGARQGARRPPGAARRARVGTADGGAEGGDRKGSPSTGTRDAPARSGDARARREDARVRQADAQSGR
jgi:hypothetical protein